MSDQIPSWQLTTSGPSRRVATLELALRSLPAGSHRRQKGRLAALCGERAEPKRPAEHRPKAAAGWQFPDDAS
ncbi:hypothetical protein [Trebonia sp.]|uniref:hypothetical protein n=1 Tax=Trebonia sp. TaxID=2767075 RepID=UPI00262AF645|nr:hypothetical protein [Trebonia sp.]